MNSGAVVDADRPDGERHPLGEPIEDGGRGRRGCPPTELDRIPARDDVAGRELLPDLAGQRSDVEGVELDEVARALDRPVDRLADRVRPLPAALLDAHPAAGRLA